MYAGAGVADGMLVGGGAGVAFAEEGREGGRAIVLASYGVEIPNQEASFVRWNEGG